MVAIDTDVFIIRYSFARDPRFVTVQRFLREVRSHSPAITLYNLMEMLGQLSFNLSPEQLGEWEEWLIRANRLAVIWPSALESDQVEEFIREELHSRPFALMQEQKMAYLDSLILGLVESTPEVDTFVTWNARHFQGKTFLEVLTPGEFLARFPREE